MVYLLNGQAKLCFRILGKKDSEDAGGRGSNGLGMLLALIEENLFEHMALGWE